MQILEGYRPDEEDTRDEKFAFAGLEEPDTKASLWVPSMEVRSQVWKGPSGARYKTSACTGFALTYALRMAYCRIGIDPGNFSPFDAYFNGRAVMGTEHLDTGTYLRDVFKAVQLLGCALEKDWPSEREHLTNVNKHPSFKARRSAYKWKGLKGYRRIIGRPEDYPRQVRIALSRGQPVVGGWMTRRDLWEYEKGVYSPNPQSPVVSGHAMCIEGFEGDVTRLVDSAGPDRGEGGFVRVDDAFIAEAHVLWVVDVRGK